MTKIKYFSDGINIIDDTRSQIELNDASTKLLQEIDYSLANNIVEFFSSTGALGIYASSKNPNVHFYEIVTNIQDAETVSQNLIANKIKNGFVYPLNQMQSILNQPDLIVVRTILEKRKSLIIDTVLDAITSLNPTGYLYLIGAKKEGIQSISKQLAETLNTSPETVTFRKGVHLIKLKLPPNISLKKESSELIYNEYEVRGLKIKLKQDNRIFAKGKLDPATKLLIENIDVEGGAKVLDIGCGSGVLGIAVLKIARNSDVVFSDNEFAAISVTRENLKLNGIINNQVILSNGLKSLKSERFNIIISNPPFHQGKYASHSTAEQFIEESFRALLPQGKLFLVCNIFLPYEKTIKGTFGNCLELAKNLSYKILLATKR